MSVKIGMIADVHHTDKADKAWGGGGLGPVQWRKYSMAEARLTAFCNAMHAVGDVDVCVQLGDFIDMKDPISGGNVYLEEIVAVVTNSDWMGPWYNVVGNHEQASWRDDFSAYEARINNSSYDDPYVQNSADIGYSFDVGGIHFIVLFLSGLGGSGAPNWASISTWLTANLAATDLPVIIFSHAHLSGITDYPSYVSSHASAARTIFENAGNVQAVICGHYHWDEFDTIINNIPYYNLRGSVLSATEQDSHNAYYLFEIIPNAIYTAGGMKANIKITGYEEGSGKITDFVIYSGLGA